MSILTPYALRCVLVSVPLTPTWGTIFWTTGAPWQFYATGSGKWLLCSVIVKRRRSIMISRTSSTRLSLLLDGLTPRSSSCTCCRPSVNCLHQRRTIFLVMTSGPYTWHRWRWISIGAMSCAFKNFIIDRTLQSEWAGIRASIFNRNDATVRTREVLLEHGCANHATEGKCFCPPSTAVT